MFSRCEKVSGAIMSTANVDPPPAAASGKSPQGRSHRGKTEARALAGSEPTLLALDVDLDEFLVRFGEVDDALDQANQARDGRAESDGQHRDQQHDHPLL